MAYIDDLLTAVEDKENIDAFILTFEKKFDIEKARQHSEVVRISNRGDWHNPKISRELTIDYMLKVYNMDECHALKLSSHPSSSFQASRFKPVLEDSTSYEATT